MKETLLGIVALMIVVAVVHWIDTTATTMQTDKTCVTFNDNGLMASLPCSNAASNGGLAALDEHLMAQFKLIRTCLDDHEDYAGFRRCLR